MLPTTKSQIHQYNDEWMVAGIGNTVSEFNVHYNHEHYPKHLYLVSDREIKEGEWNNIDKVIQKTNKRQSEMTNKELFNYGIGKIEATTDSCLNLPLIPQSFIEEYVKAEGKINEVEIEMEPFYDELVICTNKNECIVVMPLTEEYVSKVGVSITPEKTYTNAEVRALCHEAYHRAIYDFDIMNEDSSNFADWWDKQNLK